EHPVDPDAENKAILQKLQEQVAQADEKMRNMQNGLVSPDKMASLLEGLLNRNPKLHLVSFKTLPVASLNDAFSPRQEDKEKMVAPAPTAGSVQQNSGADALYKHGVEIAVQGTYFDIMQYMAQLEGMPWQLVWGKANLHVDEYPKATLTLELYTLSMEKKWLNI
ncbi:MAG TPA: MSHA biogenesis protein MshJ, partial [Noviherbaspirillum sp.]|nr:MSHA biogenesis protein MshJ [Noviherbaspirillum sp.]